MLFVNFKRLTKLFRWKLKSKKHSTFFLQFYLAGGRPKVRNQTTELVKIIRVKISSLTHHIFLPVEHRS